MCDSFTEGFCLKLQGVLPPEQIRAVKDVLNIYTMNYRIEQITTELSLPDYQLPEAYYIFMAAKEQDGKLKPGTREQYRMCIEKMLFSLQLPLDKITVNHLRLHIQEISRNPKTGAPLSKVTINQRKSIIRSFFSWLYEEEYIEKDPSRRIKPDKTEPKPRTAYKDIQIEALKQSCKTLRERAIIDLLTSSGIRIAECARLNRSDVDFMQREIRVFGKGEKWRTSYIDASAVVSLQSYLASRTDDNPALFVSSRRPHKRITTGAIRRALHGLTEDSGVEDIIPHRFRHTMATTAINAGMPVESVQAILGHSEISTTMRYAHVSSDKVKQDHKRYLQK